MIQVITEKETFSSLQTKLKQPIYTYLKQIIELE